MISYELAKKLRNAGFSQGKCLNTYDFEGTYGPRLYFGVEIEDDDQCDAPTLEELIEACGDKFHCLIHTINGGIDSNKEFWSAGYNADVSGWQSSSTPDEAVAFLWLSLQLSPKTTVES